MAHGYQMATVKGYAQKRVNEWRRELAKLDGAPQNTGKPNLAGWKQLEHFLQQTDSKGRPLGMVQRGGDSLVAAA